jgi:thiamine-monophosphate kinase
LIISITAIGEADEEEIVYETEPNKPILLVVTGDIGSLYGIAS